jgi:RND family efflux transporter MFP subunit
MVKRLIPVLGIILLLIVSCKAKVQPGALEVKRQAVSGVTLATVPFTEVESFYEAAGTVKAKAVSIISARTMGVVISVKVREGDRVSPGQELLVLDDRDMAQKVAAAESGYKEALKTLDEARQQRSLADITYRRYKNLFDEKVISGQEMDQVETQKKVADLGYERTEETVNRSRAQAEEARINKGFTKITAPHGGVITEKRIEQGSMATPGIPLLVLEDTSLFKVDTSINERLLEKVKRGMPVSIMLAGIDKRVAGTIGEIVPAVDPATRSFLIRVYLKEPALRSGLYVKIAIPEGKKQALLVPAKALVEKGQLTGVYVVDDLGVMTYRIIKTGQTYGGEVEVVSGLKPDERIAVGGLEHAVDGGIVKQ